MVGKANWRSVELSLPKTIVNQKPYHITRGIAEISATLENFLEHHKRYRDCFLCHILLKDDSKLLQIQPHGSPYCSCWAINNHSQTFHMVQVIWWTSNYLMKAFFFLSICTKAQKWSAFIYNICQCKFTVLAKD